MTPSRAVVLIGSAKAAGASTSESLARYLIDRLQAHGVACEMATVDRSIAGDHRKLLAALAVADLFVVGTPLYVDSLPYLVIRALEAIARVRGQGPGRRPCAFAAMLNCGFPEAAQCGTAVAMTKLFARRARFDWAGGLALGEGGAIDGKRLEDLGRLTKHVRAALDLAAAALAEGRTIPGDAIAGMARPLMPSAVYTAVGNFGWRRLASRNGVRAQLDARPYAAKQA